MNPEQRLRDLASKHSKSYKSSSDEVWGRDPVCASDGHSWPCSTAEAIALVHEELSHRVNPVIGWLRLHPGDEAMSKSAADRLVEAVAFFAEVPR